VWGPPALKPSAIEMTPKTHCTSSISVKFQVWGRGDIGIKEKGVPIPFCNISFPRGDIPEKFLVKTDMVKTVSDPPSKVDHAL